MRRNSVQTAGLESAMLKRIRTGNGISRVALARDLGLSPSTAGVYVERLMEQGFLTESAKAGRQTGRPPKLLHLNPNGGEFIGVDFEARNIMAVAVDFADRPLRHAHRQIAEGDSVARIIGKLRSAITDVMPEDKSRLLAIGVGAPGIVDPLTGTAVDYRFIAHWRNVALVARLGGSFQVPIFLENNMRAMALAEMWFGQGRGCGDFVCICVRSGMGGGIVSNGRLHRGAHSSAGELGRWRCPPDSGVELSYFGGDALETAPELQDVASARALQRALQRAVAAGKATTLRSLGRSVGMDDVVQAAHDRDGLTLEVIGQAAAALGTALGQLALVLDPAKMILAGHLTVLGETFLKPLRQAVGAAMKPSGLKPPEIVNSTLGDYVGALGAAALALHEWKPRRGGKG